MTALHYYNEHNPYRAAVLRERMDEGMLPKGVVDERDIEVVPDEDFLGYTQIHLFAGIGGFPLGLRLAGFPEDRRIVSGGFPCQDISNAGKRAGITGSRSRLWREMVRCVRVVRPELVFGGRWCVAFAWYDRSSSLWRTWQRCLVEGWASFSETWPRSVMTRSGIAYRPQTLEPLTLDDESGLWPTMRAHESGNYPGPSRENGAHQLTLDHAVKRWPTPTVDDANQVTRKSGAFQSLTREVQRWNGLQSHGVNVVTGSLNPTWVEWIMGYPSEWTVLRRSAMPSSRNARRKPSKG